MKFSKKKDIIIIAIILAIGIGTWLTYNFVSVDKSAKVEIYYYSELVETIDLNEGVDRIFSVPQEPNVIFHLYEDGKICFEESDCPDKVCINTGKIGKIGQYAACLPNGIVIKIVPSGNRDEDDIDIIVGN